MNYCPNCGAQIREGAKFCNSCGFNLKEEQNNYHKENSDTSEDIANSSVITIDKARVSKASKGYLSYFIQTLREPTTSFNETNSFYGFVQFFLISLVHSLSILFATLTSYIQLSFGTFLGLFLLTYIGSFISFIIIFGIRTLLQKSSDSFGKTVSQYSGFFSSYLAMQIIVMIFNLIAPEQFIVFSLILTILSGIVSLSAFTAYIYGSTNKGKVDNFYITIIGYILLVLGGIIIYRISTAVAFNIIQDLISNFQYDFY